MSTKKFASFFSEHTTDMSIIMRDYGNIDAGQPIIGRGGGRKVEEERKYLGWGEGGRSISKYLGAVTAAQQSPPLNSSSTSSSSSQKRTEKPAAEALSPRSAAPKGGKTDSSSLQKSKGGKGDKLRVHSSASSLQTPAFNLQTQVSF